MASTSVSIIKGSDKVFYVRIVSKDTGEPYAIGTASEIKLIMPLQAGGALTKKLSDADGSVEIIGDGHIGKIKFYLTEIDTAQLKAGEALSFEVEVTVATITSVVQFVEMLNVTARLF